uniref:Arginase n=1 Tax=Ascaris suum TaxID=6253 RepID=F1L3Y9_ASCSU
MFVYSNVTIEPSTMTIIDDFLSRQISIIGCANGSGGRQVGCELAAPVINQSEYLRKCPLNFNWTCTINESVFGRRLAALPGVLKLCSELSCATAGLVRREQEFAVIGGDHSCAIGTWSGIASALRPKGNVGLIWVDAHLDSHRPETSDTGNLHGMPVAHLLGYGAKQLKEIGDRQPKIKPSDLAFIGIRSYEVPERKLLEELGVRIFYIDEVDERGIQDVLQEAIEIVNRDTIGFGISIDIDGFRVEDAPAVGTPEDGGIVASEFLDAITNSDLSNLIATEIVEFLPRFDDEQKTSERLVIDLLRTIYTTKFSQLYEMQRR